MQMQAATMNSMKKMPKRKRETVVISGVKRFTGEKSRLGLAMFRETQQPLSSGAPSCTSSVLPTFTKKEVTLDLLLYWSRRSQRLMFSETSSSRWKLSMVSASSTEEMLLHCSCPLADEKEHSMLQVYKLVSRSSFMCSGRMTYWDSMLREGFMAELGTLKQSHFEPRSFAITNLLTGSAHWVLSCEVSILRSQNLTPFLYPRAFCSSYPPNCIRSSFPPGAEQKLTTSCWKYSEVWVLMSWQRWLLASCGPRVISPLERGRCLSCCGICPRSRCSLWQQRESVIVNTSMKKRRHPSRVYPSRLETFSSPWRALEDLPLPLALGGERNSSLLESEMATGHLLPATISGMLKAMSDEDVVMSSVMSTQAYPPAKRARSSQRIGFDICLSYDYKAIII